MSHCSRRSFLEVGARLGLGAMVVSQLPACHGGALDGSVMVSANQAQLTFAKFPKLQTVGGGVVVDASGTLVAVLRTSDTAATALSAVCTHEGCTLDYVGGQAPLNCACHGSEFGADGLVLAGPARTSLHVYAATLGADGVTVTLA